MDTLSQSEMAALLGRPLTSTEVTNYDLYLENAVERVEGVLCFPLCSDGTTKTFKAREGYSTVFTPVYTSIGEVQLNGSVTTEFTSYFFSDLNRDYYNSLVFDCKLKDGDTVTVIADWGFDTIPSDLKQLVAKFFNLVSSGTKVDTGVTRKQVEDFSISFSVDKTAEEQLIDANAHTISKYSLCSVGNVQHGGVCSIWT